MSRPGPQLTPIGMNRYRLANTEFVTTMNPRGSDPSMFFTNKPPELIEVYPQLLARFRFGTIVQLTGSDGGSAALACYAAAPAVLVVLSTFDDELDALDKFVERRGLQDVVRRRNRIDRTDRAALFEVASEELAGAAPDLVIDDVSNSRDAACLAFEALFPLLPPGGRYVIEGWNWEHRMVDAMVEREREEGGSAGEAAAAAPTNGGQQPPPRRSAPVEAILPELVDLCRASPGVVDSVTAAPFWIELSRGPDPLPPGALRLPVDAEPASP